MRESFATFLVFTYNAGKKTFISSGHNVEYHLSFTTMEMSGISVLVFHSWPLETKRWLEYYNFELSYVHRIK